MTAWLVGFTRHARRAETGLLDPERRKDLALHQRFPALARGGFQHRAGDGVARVGVEKGAGLGARIAAKYGCRIDDPVGHHVPVVIRAHQLQCGDRAGIGDDAGPVLHQVHEGGAGILRADGLDPVAQVLGDGVLPVDDALLYEARDEHRRHRLGVRAQMPEVGQLDGRVTGFGPHSGHGDYRLAVVDHHHDRAGRAPANKRSSIGRRGGGLKQRCGGDGDHVCLS